MINELISLLQHFKQQRNDEKLVLSQDDRAMAGLFAVAQSIDRLTQALLEFKPMVAAAVDAYINQPEYIIDDSLYDVGPNDVERVKAAITHAVEEYENDREGEIAEEPEEPEAEAPEPTL